MYRLLFVFCLFLTGCNGCDVRNKIGLGPTTSDEVAIVEKEDKEKKLEEDRKRLEEEKQRLEEDRKRLEEEKRRHKEQQLKDADLLMQKTTEQLQTTATSDGFIRQDGLNELDPWGNPLKIDFQQEWFDEIATIRSAGPDGKMNTTDDLVRNCKVSKPNGILRGMSWEAWVGLVWLLTGFLGLIFSVGLARRRKEQGKTHKHSHPVLFIIGVMIFAPLVFLIFGLQLIGNALGLVGDFFDGFDGLWD